MRKFLVLVAFVPLTAYITFAQSGVQLPPISYKYRSIDFPNATTTQVFGTNEHADVVGSYVDTSGNTHGFSLMNGRFTTIDFPGALLTAARAINDSGTVAGGFTPPDDPNGGHGFVLRGKKYYQVDFPGSAHSGNLGIDEAGDLTGSYDLGDVNTGIGFFTKNGEFISFEVPDSAPQTTGPHGINDSGLVTGFFLDRTDPNITHAFFKLQSLFKTVDFPGASITGFFGVNERGDAVGACTLLDHTVHGLLFSRGVFTFIDYPGADHTRPRGINDRGQIVGFFDVAGAIHGFIATPVGLDE